MTTFNNLLSASGPNADDDITLEIGGPDDNSNGVANFAGHCVAAGDSHDAIGRAGHADMDQIQSDAAMARAVADGSMGKRFQTTLDPFTNREVPTSHLVDSAAMLDQSEDRDELDSNFTVHGSNDSEIDITHFGNGNDETDDEDRIDVGSHGDPNRSRAPSKGVARSNDPAVRTAIDEKAQELRAEYGRLIRECGRGAINQTAFENVLAGLDMAQTADEVKEYGTLFAQTERLATLLTSHHRFNHLQFSPNRNAADFARAARAIAKTDEASAKARCMELLTDKFKFTPDTARSILGLKRLFGGNKAMSANLFPELRQELEEIAAGNLVGRNAKSGMNRQDLLHLLKLRAQVRSRLLDLQYGNLPVTHAMWGAQPKTLNEILKNADNAEWVTARMEKGAVARDNDLYQQWWKQDRCVNLLTKTFGLKDKQVNDFLDEADYVFGGNHRALTQELESIANIPRLLKKPAGKRVPSHAPLTSQGKYSRLLDVLNARHEARVALTPIHGRDEANRLVAECTTLDKLKELEQTAVHPIHSGSRKPPSKPAPRKPRGGAGGGSRPLGQVTGAPFRHRPEQQQPQSQQAHDDAMANSNIKVAMNAEKRSGAENDPLQAADGKNMRPTRGAPVVGQGLDADAATRPNEADQLISSEKHHIDD